MSRAFITDKEDWIYCPKAGERCMHAEEGKDCTETGCEYFDKNLRQIIQPSVTVKVVKKKSKEIKTPATAEPRRTTKKSKVKKPKKWGGRNSY